MARKNPFTRVMVDRRIYAAVAKVRELENAGQIRTASLNAYCEQILWDYAQGNLVRRNVPRRAEEPILGDVRLSKADPKRKRELPPGHEKSA